MAGMALRRFSWWQMMAYVYTMVRFNHREHRGTEEIFSTGFTGFSGLAGSELQSF
jgi:hypothetical protein